MKDVEILELANVIGIETHMLTEQTEMGACNSTWNMKELKVSWELYWGTNLLANLSTALYFSNVYSYIDVCKFHGMAKIERTYLRKDDIFFIAFIV